MASLTAMECLLLEEHFRSENAMIQLLQYAQANCNEPRCKNICETMLREHREQSNNLARFINL